MIPVTLGRRGFIAVFLLCFSPAYAQAPKCAAQLEQLVRETETQRLHELYYLIPDGTRDPKTGDITLDLTRSKTLLLPELKKRGFVPDEVVVELDRQRFFQIPEGQNTIRIKAGPTNRMRDCRIVFKQDGKEVHVTETRLFESTDFPVVDKIDYAKYPLPEWRVPDEFAKRKGIDPELVRLSAQLQRENINWTISDKASPALKRAFEKYGSDLKLSITFGRDKRTPTAISIYNQKTRKSLPARLEDIHITGGAAFNWNFFDWDSEFVKRYLRFFDGWLAEKMRKFKLKTQEPNGAVPRELRANMTSYHREHNVKLGEVTPNREYFNPPLTGWSERQVLRWDPAKAGKVLPEMIQSSEKQRAWLLKHHSVTDENGKLIGFRWTNLGSGRDNAARGLDEGGLGVDLITYYKMMMDQEREFHLMLGNWNKAEEIGKAADELKSIINQRYWSDKHGMYVDLVASGQSWKQDSNLAATGFWPAMGGVPDEAKMGRMIQDNLRNPKRFDGDFPPSTSKDSPHYNPAGHYWRGGGWPPDFVFFGDLLFENGKRAEAARLHGDVLRSYTMASKAYQNGDSPRAWINGKVGADEASEMSERGTVFEFYGLKEDGNPTFGREFRPDGSAHETRKNFAGWGSAPPLESLRTIMGFDAVPAFAGPKRDLNRWVWTLLTDRQFSYHQVKANPALKPLVEYLTSNPKPDFESFNKVLASGDRRLREEIQRLGRGYLEVSPTFDPKAQTEVKNLVYDGVQFEMRIEKLDGDNHVRLTLKSDRKIPVQFNRNWTGDETTDSAAASSKILEIGGDTPVIDLYLTPTKKPPQVIGITPDHNLDTPNRLSAA